MAEPIMIETYAYEYLTFGCHDGIATITLANPERRNALSAPTMSELIAALDAAGKNRSVRVVALRAHGPDVQRRSPPGTELVR